MSLRSALRGAAEHVLVRLPRTTRPGDRLILAYHNVVPNDWTPRGDLSLHMPLHKFEAQLKMIRNEAEIVPLMDILTQDAPNERRVAITFDDAYASAMKLGVGACAASEAACTVFVTPGLLGTVPLWDRRADEGTWSMPDREHFLWQQQGRLHNIQFQSRAETADAPIAIATESELLESLSSTGALLSLGNHTMTHANLGALSTTELYEELLDCEAWLRTHANGRHLPVVAYPYGIAPSSSSVIAGDNKGAYGLMANGGWYGQLPKENFWLVPRYNVTAGVSREGFEIRLRGRFIPG